MIAKGSSYGFVYLSVYEWSEVYPQSYAVDEENNAVCRLRSNLNRTVFRNKLLNSEQ